jgi:DHA1 family multidrug resistance protein-like MFS transporter
MNWKVTLGILTASSVLMSMSYTMLIPFLPMYLVKELGVASEHLDLWTGAIFSITFLVSGIMAPIWGALADRKSRKLMALRAGFCLAITYFLGGLVQGPWQLFAVRFIQGLSAGLWPALLSILSSCAPKSRLGFCMGVMQGGMTAGGVLGPLFGGLLAEVFGMRSTFFIAGASLFTITLMILFYVKEAPKPAAAEVKKPVKIWDFSLLKVPAIKRMLLCAAVAQISILLTQPILPLYIAQLQGSMDQIVLISGVVFSICGISGVIASPPWGILGQQWGYRPVLYLTLLGAGIFNIIQAFPDTLTGFTIWRFIGGLAFAGIFPAINAVLTISTDAGDKGRVFGLSYLAQQIGSMLGPLVGSGLSAFFSYQAVIAASGIVLIPMAVYLWWMRPKTPQTGSGSVLRSTDE